MICFLQFNIEGSKPFWVCIEFFVICLVHPTFSSFGFWYFGHFSCVIFFPVFFRLAHLALQNVNKDCVIFLHFCNFVAKSGQKTKNSGSLFVKIRSHSWIMLAHFWQTSIPVCNKKLASLFLIINRIDKKPLVFA